MLFRSGAKRRIAQDSARISRNGNRVVNLESLEERRLLATFVVTSNGDIPVMMGTTLREAILSANLLPAADTITFSHHHRRHLATGSLYRGHRHAS